MTKEIQDSNKTTAQHASARDAPAVSPVWRKSDSHRTKLNLMLVQNRAVREAMPLPHSYKERPETWDRHKESFLNIMTSIDTRAYPDMGYLQRMASTKNGMTIPTFRSRVRDLKRYGFVRQVDAATLEKEGHELGDSKIDRRRKFLVLTEAGKVRVDDYFKLFILGVRDAQERELFEIQSDSPEYEREIQKTFSEEVRVSDEILGRGHPE